MREGLVNGDIIRWWWTLLSILLDCQNCTLGILLDSSLGAEYSLKALNYGSTFGRLKLFFFLHFSPFSER